MCTGMLPGERRLGAGLICGVGVEILFSLLGGELKPSYMPHRKPEPWAVRVVEVGILQLIPNNLFCTFLLESVHHWRNGEVSHHHPPPTHPYLQGLACPKHSSQGRCRCGGAECISWLPNTLLHRVLSCCQLGLGRYRAQNACTE